MLSLQAYPRIARNSLRISTRFLESRPFGLILHQSLFPMPSFLFASPARGNLESGHNPCITDIWTLVSNILRIVLARTVALSHHFPGYKQGHCHHRTSPELR